MLNNCYKDIKVTPFEFERVLSLKMFQKINEHAILHLTGVIHEFKKDEYAQITKSGQQIQVILPNENRFLFTGMVQDIGVKHINKVYHIEITAVSNTYLMDIEFKSRSFQNIDMLYETMFKQISSEYLNADMIDTKTNIRSLGNYTLQYHETDWKFIKRMASRFNTVLIPCVSASSPKYFFGIPQQSEFEKIEQYNYSVTKKLGQYMEESQNTNQGLNDLDRIYFEVESEKILDLGTAVTYKDIKLYVAEIKCEIIKGVLTFSYVLLTERGMSQSTYHNEIITGLSIKGRVLDRINDKVKVHMEIDNVQSVGDAFEFPFTTSYVANGNSGWYCMPEVGDTVFIYHPDMEEKNAVSLNSVRENPSASDKITDPTIKYFRTIDGKELKFSPEEILITSEDDKIYIRLNEKTGIEIYSTLPINITTQDNLNINSDKKISIEAFEEIELTCRSSKIKMDDSLIKIQGKEILNN